MKGESDEVNYAHVKAIELAQISGRGCICIATPRMVYLVNFRLYGDEDQEVIAQYRSFESSSEFFEFSNLEEFMQNVRESVEQYDKGVAATGITAFPADAMVVQNKKDPGEFFVVARRGRVVEEICSFRADSFEEARRFYEEHREVDDR